MVITGGLEGIVRKGIATLSLIGVAALSGCGYIPPRQPSPTLPPPEVHVVTYTPTATQTSTPTLSPTPTLTLSPTLEPTYTPSPTATETPLPTATPTEACDGERKIVVNSNPDVQMIYAIIEYPCSGNIELVHSSQVSSGTYDHPTVLGEYKINRKYISTDMAGPGYYLPDVPYTMYFYEGYGIHGAYWHHSFGIRMSHGCVNLPIDPGDSINLIREDEWFYKWGYVGMKVISCSDDPNYGIYTEEGDWQSNDYYEYCQILR